MEINVLTPAEGAYWAAEIALAGRPVSPRGIPTREVQNFTMHVQHPHLSPYLEGRNARHFIGAVEALQLVGQTATPDIVIDNSKAMERFSDHGIFHGAYGQRAYGQLHNVQNLLLNDGSTRQAVLNIYDGHRDLINGSHDTPCTLTIQFLWQESRLGMRVSMRSNDVWLGLPYDLFQFTALHCAMADALEVDPGIYTHTVGSLHAYESDMESITSLKNPGEPTRDKLHYTPRWGSDGLGIHGVSRRARNILFGKSIDMPTPFEQYLYSVMGAVK